MELIDSTQAWSVEGLGMCQILLQLQAWVVSTKWSAIISFFSYIILIFHQYRKPSINMISIITVKLFVTTARLAWDQTLVITVKISARNGY